MHCAVKHDRENIAKVLLAQEPNPLLHLNRNRENILHEAVMHENTGIINLILDHIRTTEHEQDCSNAGEKASDVPHRCDCPITYPGIDAEDNRGLNPLQLAITRVALTIVSLLLPFFPSGVNAPRMACRWSNKALHLTDTIYWIRPLHIATHSSSDLLQVLLNAGANIDLSDSTNQTPLANAIHWKREEAFKVLLAHGANYMTVCAEHPSQTLLEESVQAFSPTILDVLMTSHPTLDISTSGAARAVLKQAQIGGRWEMVRTLVEQCTQKDQVGKILDEETLFHALTSSTPEIFGFLLQSGVNIDVICHYDYKAHQYFKHWRKPIHIVAGYGKADIAVVLLEKGASILSRAGNGWLPLHQAIRFANMNTIQYFLEQSINGIKLTGGSAGEGDSRYTGIIKRAMKIACKRGSLEIIKLILERSNLSFAELGKEALHTAVQFGRRDVTEHLLRHSTYSLATLNIAQKAKFKNLQDEEKRPGNHLKDYEKCRLLVADAIYRA